MSNLYKKVELTANVAIILVAALLGGVLFRQYMLPKSAAPAPAAQHRQVSKGETVSLPGVDWGRNGRTLVMALSTACHFCTESAPFYQRLAKGREGKPVKFVAVFPQQPDDGRQYLSRLDVSVDEVQQAPPGGMDVAGTPTLILVNDQGKVENVWVGKLPPEKEDEVVSSL